MKNLRKAFGILLLSVAFASTSFGGDMPGGIVNPPPPPPPTEHSQSIGEISQSTETADLNIHSMDPLTEGLLSMLQSLLSLF